MKPLLLCLFASISTVSLAAERPNILLVMCDDLGYADVGFNGAKDIKTPALDQLAAAGTIFRSAYVAHPFCGPSRMALLSGRYPHKFGGQFNLAPFHSGLKEYDEAGIPQSEVLISTVLQDAGYRTGVIGKWHVGSATACHPNNRGFDDFYGFLGGGHNYFPERYTASFARHKKAGTQRIHEYVQPLEHNGKPVEPKGYLTDELSGEAVRFIDAAANKDREPFFLYLAYNAPHAPMEATVEDEAVFAGIANPTRRTYAAMVYAVDRGVGQIVDALKRGGMFDNTLIVFLSDNGGKPSQGASNAPLRGAKGDIWEGGFRVPMFCHWPGAIPAQMVYFPVSSLDLYPTFAALGGAEIPAGKELDGVNLLDALKSGDNPRAGDPIYAMRHNSSHTDVSVRVDHWKAARNGNQEWRLFNITKDPGESKDLATQHRGILGNLVKQAEQWSTSHAEPRFFHATGIRDAWKKNNLPHFDQTFELVTGAPALAGVRHITDQDVAAIAGSASPGTPVPTPSVKLTVGDSTLPQYVERERAKWAQKGWDWSLKKVEARFREIDVDGNGIITGKEKKTFYSGGVANVPSTATAPANPDHGLKLRLPPPAPGRLKVGDSDLDHFMSVRKAQAERSGQKFSREGVEKLFGEMDADKNGIVSGREKKAHWDGAAAKSIGSPPDASSSASDANPAKPAPDVKLKNGQSDLQHFISTRASQAEKKGRKFNLEAVKKTFVEMDSNKDGIVTGLEKKAYWQKK